LTAGDPREDLPKTASDNVPADSIFNRRIQGAAPEMVNLPGRQLSSKNSKIFCGRGFESRLAKAFSLGIFVVAAEKSW
jgi:hypothetical protein